MVSYSGVSDWNSPTFNIPDNVSSVSIKYSYANNDDSNFIGDVQSSSDDNNFANTIGTDGGTTTTVYPSPSGDNSYHLSIMASGSWSVTITINSN